MWKRFGLHHLLWIFPVAVVIVACSGNTTSPTAATSVSGVSGAASGSGPTSGTTGTSSAGIGTLSVSIKDSPFSEATAVLVTFSEVSVHMSGSDATDGEWKTLSFAGDATGLTCDLKKLEAATDLLATDSLTAGHYTQLRLTVSGATIYTTGTAPEVACATDLAPWSAMSDPMPVTVASGTLKLNREFTVPTGAATTILLDFDGDKSIHKTGNGKYLMTPVIGVVSVQ
ncbi:MAG: DUF4382 domain-containing protein [Acidobacteria bacterium]|nr:DUF4382 domain-containing protein [Acidobacteriota bacterium]